MADPTLEEKELRVQEAKLKLAWFEEQDRELQLWPQLRDYLRLRDMSSTDMTPEEEARSHELGNSLEAVQFVDNLCDRIEARQELSRATLDLIEYQTSNKLAGPKPNEQWRSHNNAASSDDGPPIIVVCSPESSNESSSRGAMEKNALQQQQLPPALPELKQRKRSGL